MKVSFSEYLEKHKAWIALDREWENVKAAIKLLKNVELSKDVMDELNKKNNDLGLAWLCDFTALREYSQELILKESEN